MQHYLLRKDAKNIFFGAKFSFFLDFCSIHIVLI